MRSNGELASVIEKAFCTALLLTASETLAETAVLDGIGALEFDQISSDNLQLETARSATRESADLLEQFDPAFSILPGELRCVLLLEQRFRHCFVLRVLLGLTRETCSIILHLPLPEVDNAVRTAMQRLPLLNVAASLSANRPAASVSKGG
jgi:hypothetical protein